MLSLNNILPFAAVGAIKVYSHCNKILSRPVNKQASHSSLAAYFLIVQPQIQIKST